MAIDMEEESKITHNPPLLLAGNVQHLYAADEQIDISKTVKKLDFLFSIADALQMDVVAFFKPMTEESFQKWRRDH